jgi:sec-independent protein translocase protein TatA
MRIGPFGVWEILIILIVILLIFGPRRLPEMAKGLGQSVRAFRKEMRDFRNDLESDDVRRSAPTEQPAAPVTPPVPPRSEPAAEVDPIEPARTDEGENTRA